MLYFQYKIKRNLIMSHKTELILKAYEAIGNLTPLKSDCGRLCNAVCCKGDDDTGMLLFPGEEELYQNDDCFTVTKTDYGMPLLLCRGMCQRDKRPLSCRIFPLALVNKDGFMKVIADPRSRVMCPLYRQAANNRLDPAFVKAVKEAGKILFEDEELRSFMQAIYNQCLEFTGL